METINAKLNNFLPKSDVENYINQLKFDEKKSDSKNKFFAAPNAIIARFIQTKFGEILADFFESEDGERPLVRIYAPNSNLGGAWAQNDAQNGAQNINVSAIKAETSQFNQAHTFDTFVIDGSNQVAYTACYSVGKNQPNAYNIVFIYGSTGLGKSHLLHAIGNCCAEQGRKVIYTTGESFTTEFINSLQNKTMAKFKQKYRSCEVLLIDDIQFLAASEKSQEEFFYTFEEVRANGGSIVLASDKPPKQLHGFADRLKSRFEWELCTDITPPGLDTKIRIIESKCEIEGVYLSKDIVQFIAANMGDNIREIQSAVINIGANARVMGHEITLDFAKNIIKDQIRDRNEKVSLDDIIAGVAREYEVKQSDIRAGVRTKQVTLARQVCSFLAKNLISSATAKQLASELGMSDHSAIVKNNKKIEKTIDEDSLFKAKIEEIKNKILSKK